MTPDERETAARDAYARLTARIARLDSRILELEGVLRATKARFDRDGWPGPPYDHYEALINAALTRSDSDVGSW